MTARLKPFVHWAIYKGHTVRYTKRTPALIAGILTTAQGAIPFEYDPVTQRIRLPDQEIAINQHGWEVTQDANPQTPPSHPSENPGENDLV